MARVLVRTDALEMWWCVAAMVPASSGDGVDHGFRTISLVPRHGLRGVPNDRLPRGIWSRPAGAGSPVVWPLTSDEDRRLRAALETQLREHGRDVVLHG